MSDNWIRDVMTFLLQRPAIQAVSEGGEAAAGSDLR